MVYVAVKSAFVAPGAPGIVVLPGPSVTVTPVPGTKSATTSDDVV
jgi:hypothetical protein